MIGFSRLEQKGNIGNQLFQIVSTIGIATENNQEYVFPKWKYSSYFKNSLPELGREGIREFKNVKEDSSIYQKFILTEGNYDLEGWLQSEKYFDINKAKYFLTFNESIIDSLKQKYSSALEKKTLLISIRRGDFVDHPDFYQLPFHYYLTALVEHFPDWREYSIFVFSDDIEYVKYHFDYADNFYFNDNLTVIEQLALSTLCENFIISNSTFSWWCAWLGEKENSKIVRPYYNFTPEMRKTSDDIDFFPRRWIRHKHENVQIKLMLRSLDIREKKYLYDYYSSYFDFIMSEESSAKVLINDIFLPPLVFYDAVSINRSSEILTKRNVYVSENKELKLLFNQFDFGLFSTIFKSSNTHKSEKVCEVDNEGTECKNVFVINYSGKVSNLKGNKFLLKKRIRKMKFKVKRMIKIMLRIKKKY
jgi:hypothetical protein